MPSTPASRPAAPRVPALLRLLAGLAALALALPIVAVGVLYWPAWPPWPQLGALVAAAGVLVLKDVATRGTVPGTAGRWLLAATAAVGVVGLLTIKPGLERSFDSPYRAAMRSDLRTLAARQRSWHAAHGSFTTDLAALRLSPSTNVRIAIERADDAVFTATASHPVTPLTCRIAVAAVDAPTDSIPCTRP